MATEVPVNGNYPPPSSYDTYSYNTTGTPSQAAPAAPLPSAPSSGINPPAAQQADIPKDEVGWYFVEQYYTTLSRNPEKLYLFYNKRSQFVSGQETDKVPVCIGQKSINDRIKELDFQDCKVRVTNVDSQASDTNIVIQVIGEISNKSQPHKKFTQTFVLAAQTNGYFVLNDIFRYLIDEEDDPEAPAESGVESIQQVAAAESGYQEPVPTATGSSDPVAIERDAQQVDDELDRQVPSGQRADTDEPKVNGTAASGSELSQTEEVSAPEQPSVAETEPSTILTTSDVPQPVEQVAAPSQPKQEAAPPPPKPAAPKTWASLAASANRTSTPPASSTASSTGSQAKPPPKPAAAVPAPSASTAPQTTPSAPAAPREPSPADGSQGDEWTAVSSSHNRNQSRQANQQEAPQSRGYIKNVHEGVDGAQLKAELEKFDELLYFDISRQKVCIVFAWLLTAPSIFESLTRSQNSAFVDFKTAEGYQAAVDASPITVSGQRLFVVERYARPGAPYAPQFHGSRGRGGGGAPGAPRGNNQARGGYQSRGTRGGSGAPRGRGSSIAA
jgi:hypothetical protein